MFSLISNFCNHVAALPERNFLRLKAGEAVINEKLKNNKDIAPGKFKHLFSQYTLTGDLNRSNYEMEQCKDRRYFIYAVPHLFAMAIYSALAIPGLVIRTALTALNTLPSLAAKQSLTDATDPLLENAVNLVKAVTRTIDGVVVGIVKLATALFVDIARKISERNEKESNPTGNIGFIGVDLSPTFAPGGNLGLPGGHGVVQANSDLMHAVKKASPKNTVILTQDWHPKDHCSFGVNFGVPGSYSPLNKFAVVTVEMPNLPKDKPQDMFTAHGVQGTTEAEFLTGIPVELADLIVRKGYDRDVDSFGGFFDNNYLHKTQMDENLRKRNIKTVIITGLATDYCVKTTIKQANELSYRVIFVENASSGTTPENSEEAIKWMRTLHDFAYVGKASEIIKDGVLDISKVVFSDF